MSHKDFAEDLSVEGQPYYEERRLRFYDRVVVKASNRFLWRCDRARLVTHYDSWITGRHLEVGPGTGYYLDHCRFPANCPELTLLDLNPDPLSFAARRLRRYRPRTVRADVLAPLPEACGTGFTSVGLNYVLHCLPPPAAGKHLVFEHLKAVMASGGVLFGSTILTGGVTHTPLSRTFMRLYQRQGSFHNQSDSVSMLTEALERHFTTHQVEIQGCVALFAAKGPRRAGSGR